MVVNEEARLNRFGRKVTQHGGPVIFGFKIARLIGCLALFSLSLTTALLGSVDSTHQEVMWDWGRTLVNLPQLAMALTFVRIITNLPYRANEVYSGIPSSLLQFLLFRTGGADLWRATTILFYVWHWLSMSIVIFGLWQRILRTQSMHPKAHYSGQN